MLQQGDLNLPHKQQGDLNLPHKQQGDLNLPHEQQGDLNLPHSSTNTMRPCITNECPATVVPQAHARHPPLGGCSVSRPSTCTHACACTWHVLRCCTLKVAYVRCGTLWSALLQDGVDALERHAWSKGLCGQVRADAVQTRRQLQHAGNAKRPVSFGLDLICGTTPRLHSPTMHYQHVEFTCYIHVLGLQVGTGTCGACSTAGRGTLTSCHACSTAGLLTEEAVFKSKHYAGGGSASVRRGTAHREWFTEGLDVPELVAIQPVFACSPDYVLRELPVHKPPGFNPTACPVVELGECKEINGKVRLTATIHAFSPHCLPLHSTAPISTRYCAYLFVKFTSLNLFKTESLVVLQHAPTSNSVRYHAYLCTLPHLSPVRDLGVRVRARACACVCGGGGGALTQRRLCVGGGSNPTASVHWLGL